MAAIDYFHNAVARLYRTIYPDDNCAIDLTDSFGNDRLRQTKKKKLTNNTSPSKNYHNVVM